MTSAATAVDGTLAMILGAGDFPHTRLGANPAFSRSAQAFTRYLTAASGLKLADDCVLDLFDSELSPDGQGEQIVTFLQAHAEAQSVIVYYVGHGGFLPDRDYFLTLRSTKTGREAFTALRAKALAFVIDEHFPSKHVYLILDCCFAGQAVEIFQAEGAVGQLVTNQTVDVIRGASTALLLASSRDDPAIARPELVHTMFSSGLLSVLSEGLPGKGATLSLEEIGDAVEQRLKKNHGGEAVRPEVHAPRQDGGNIAKRPVFPNPRYKPPEPRRLSGQILKMLQSEYSSVRGDAVSELAGLLQGDDAELAALARQALAEVAEQDDSRTVRKQAGMLVGVAEPSSAGKDASAPAAAHVPKPENDATQVEAAPAPTIATTHFVAPSKPIRRESEAPPHLGTEAKAAVTSTFYWEGLVILLVVGVVSYALVYGLYIYLFRYNLSGSRSPLAGIIAYLLTDTASVGLSGTTAVLGYFFYSRFIRERLPPAHRRLRAMLVVALISAFGVMRTSAVIILAPMWFLNLNSFLAQPGEMTLAAAVDTAIVCASIYIILRKANRLSAITRP